MQRVIICTYRFGRWMTSRNMSFSASTSGFSLSKTSNGRTQQLNPSRTFVFLLEDTIRLYARRFERRSEVLGLTLAQSKLLVHLVDHEGISQVRLAELTDLEPMALTRALDSLECRGWLARSSDPADRRARRLFLQAKNKPLVDDIWHLLDLTRREAFAGIPMRQADLMIELLEKIHSNLALAEPLPVAAAAVQSGRTSAARSRRERTASQR
jgi:MarR family transcriptional regulator, transcriptional regulator for hemolysin